jgi:phosphoribosyl-ATP pyrophosphohydrolase
VASLFKLGINKIAQKVGEEAVEVVIEAKDDNDDLFKRKLICFSLLNFASKKDSRSTM